MHTEAGVLGCCFFLFDMILYVPVNNFLVMSERVGLPGLNSTKQGLMCLTQGHNALTPVRLKPTTPQSRIKHSSIEPLIIYMVKGW